MNLQKISVVLSFLFWLGSCKTQNTLPEVSVIKTDETRSALARLCAQFEPTEDTKALGESLCTCLREDRSALGQEFIEQTCSSQGLPSFTQRLKKLVLAEGEEAFRDSDDNPLTTTDHACLDTMSDFYLQMQLEELLRNCGDQRVSYEEFRSQIILPPQGASKECWVMSRMTEEACVVARPCRGSGDSDPFVLPLSSRAKQDLKDNALTWVDESQSLILCNQHMQDIHFLKDPSTANIDYNLSFANLLGFGRVQNRVTFGPANCHGTASAVSGGVLDHFKVSTITYHSPNVRNECSAIAEEHFNKAKARSSDGSVIAKHLPVERGGYLINMDHSEQCAETECGDISFAITSCNQPELVAHIFFSEMCVKCWAKSLASSGFTALPKDATWKNLIPGCVLTAADHSVAFLHASQGMCYYYESTSPFGPPQLRVDSCNHFYSRFGKRWCPASPLEFEVKLAGSL